MAEDHKDKKLKKFELDGVVYTTTINKKFNNRKKYVPPDPKKIEAVIPGTIIKILVRKGRKVEAGENLILLEAMKMQSYVQTNIDGKIKAVNVKKGQMVSKGYVMIELE